MSGASFSKLEAAVLQRFAEQYGADVPGLAEQLAHARLIGRENTGRGFFADIVVDRQAVSPLAGVSQLDGPLVRLGSMTRPVEMLLFMKDGFVSLLEGHAASVEDPASLDIEHDPFEFVADLSPMGETIRVLRSVPGGDRVIAWVNRVPGRRSSFGDMEVVTVSLRRGGKSTIEIGLEGQPTFTFHFDDWLDVNLEGFGRQNVLGGLILRPDEPREVRIWELGLGYEYPTVEMVLEPCYGANGVIRGRLLRVEMT